MEQQLQAYFIMGSGYSSSGQHKWYLKCHLLISYPPNISVTSIARRLKQERTRELWKRYPDWLRRHFWKERTFWSDGYFVCSIGEASPETVRRYIENQG